MSINRLWFFNHVRGPLFGGVLTAAQVEGMTALLDTWEATHAADDPRWLAYALATARHETGARMVPVVENLDYRAVTLTAQWPARFPPEVAARYAHHPEGIANRAYAFHYGNGSEASGDGWRYRGRGLAQTTFKDNYQKLGDLLGVDLVSDPERLVEDLALAPRALFEAMIHGIYTGHTLAHYFAATTDDWVGARRIISSDDAELVAYYGHQFDAALRYAT